jgi:hypothetical protein
MPTITRRLTCGLLLAIAALPLSAQDKIGINFHYRSYAQENGNNTCLLYTSDAADDM